MPNIVERAAHAAHEALRAYCQGLGDHSQKPWHEAPPWQCESAIKGVEFIRDNPDAPPSATHDSWLREKKAGGWKYGPIKDPKKREHPCYVAYDELSLSQKAKDHIASG